MTDGYGWVRHWTDLLTQHEVWQDQQGTIHRLDDLPPDRCARIHAFAMRQADAVYDIVGMQLAAAPEMSETATEAFDRAFDSFMYDTTPAAWLAGTPLLVALRARSYDLPADRSTCHCGYPLVDDKGALWDHSACHPGIIID